jgi:hypothetical protein
MASSTTRCCHAGRDDLARLGVHAPPLDLSSTYPLHDLEAAESAFGAFERGEVREHMPIYARLHNPTVGRFERALAELEGTEAAVAFASGMAAVTACLLAAREAGGHAVAVRPVYGGTDALLASGLLGLDVAWARADEVGRAMRPSTALVLVESPQNPTLGLVDIGAIVEAAAGVPVLVDNTFATPVLQNPARHGASLVLHSATKYLGGHGDCGRGSGRELRSGRTQTAPHPSPHRGRDAPAGGIPAPSRAPHAAAARAAGTGAGVGARLWADLERALDQAHAPGAKARHRSRMDLRRRARAHSRRGGTSRSRATV